MTKFFGILTALAFSATVASAHGPHPTSDNANEKLYWMKFEAKDKYDRTRIANLGVTIEAIVEDHVMAIGHAEHLKSAQKTGQLLMNFPLTGRLLDFPSHDSKFHNYAELTQALQALAARHPELAKLSSLGRTYEGRDIPLLTISKNADDKSQPAIFFLGGHHAREHVSVETPLLLAQYLVTEYAAGNARIMRLLESRTVYIAPLINPDGAEYDVASGSYRLWRKNRRSYDGRSYGVDLNRNYSYGWGGEGASGSHSHDTFRGPSAFSEPETQAVKAFVEGHPNINVLLSFHTFSKLILYPWGHKYESISKPVDLAVHEKMARTMAQWNGYTPQQSSDLYIASGDTTDWSYGQEGIISFTFELDPASGFDNRFSPERGFYPGQAQIEPTFRKNLEPCLYLIEYTDNPYRVNQPSSMAYGFKTNFLSP